MRRMISTLFRTLLLAGCFVSALGVKAAVNDDASRFYYLKTSSGEYIGVDSVRTDSLVIGASVNKSYALWSFKKSTTASGSAVYTIKNKVGTLLAFNAPATESTAVANKNGTLNLWNASLAAETELSVYSGEVSYFLAKNTVGSVANVVTLLKTSTGDAKNLKITVEDPAKVFLTKDQLNNKLGAGFKLFFSYGGKEVNQEFPLADRLFEAEATSGTDTEVKLKAKAIPAVDGKYAYAYVDTLSYTSGTPAEGAGLLFKIGIIPDRLTGNAQTALFKFQIDPGSPDTTVAVFAKGSYTLSTGTYQYLPDANVPVQIDEVATAQKLYLTTGKKNVVADSKTVIRFTGTSSTELLSQKVVYSVKFLNKDTRNGKYWGVDLKEAETLYGSAYAHLPAVQFVFNGVTLANRVNAGLKTDAIYDISGQADVFTDGTDTLEVKALAGVDPTVSTLGYAFFTDDSIRNYSVALKYKGEVLDGFAVKVAADSALVARKEDPTSFKLVAGTSDAYAAAINNEVAGLRRQPYFLKSEKKDEFVAIKDGKIILTALSKTPFFFQELTTKGQYIMVSELKTKKVNVNSSSAVLEVVDFATDNNPFVFEAQPTVIYKLDAAKAHLTFKMDDGTALAMDSVGKAGVSKVGETAFVLPQLKSKTFTADDFVFWVDSAVGTSRNAVAPSYYIVKNAVATPSASDKLSGYFLHVIDSTGTKYRFNGYQLLNFVSAERRVAGDSLLLNPAAATHVKADSIGYSGKNDAIKEYRFKFRATDTDSKYQIETETGNNGQAGFLSVINGVLVVAPEELAANFVITKGESPVANKEVKTVNVQVVGGNGFITIKNAAGKAVSVVNVLGQRLVTRRLVSDQETLSLPKGIVLVAIEGEGTVKAIVR